MTYGIRPTARALGSIAALTMFAGILPASAGGRETGARGAQPDQQRDGEAPRSLVHRERRPSPDPGGPQGNVPPGPARFPIQFRSIDGTENNLARPAWGAVGVELVRRLPAAYADGSGAPAGENRPSARAVSNAVAAQSEDLPNPLGYSDYLWQWGQFLDHDIDETPVTDPGEAFDIPVPAGDVWFDPDGSGDDTIPMDRSAYEITHGVRQQLNNITAYIDASNVYGSEHDRADELRTLDGTGRLKTSDGDLLPFNVNGFDNAPSADIPTFFLAGDIRANEQVGLTAMHTLFVREHNRLAEITALEHPEFSGDQIYEHARAIVAAEMQVITYREFLPRLLGPDAIPPYQGYRPDVNAGIMNVFATAAYRVGHTMLSPELLRLDENGDEIAGGHLPLAGAFFAPGEIIEEGIEPVLRGLAAQRAQNVDNQVIDDVRNFLFGLPDAGGFDLASLNIQRGRDHGLPSYNQIRKAFGRSPASSFAQISPDAEVQAGLASVYSSPGEVDAWVGLLAEPHRPGAFVGETLYRVLREQFVRLRDGDRFWYQAYLPPRMVRDVERRTLSDIIRLNTDIGPEIGGDVFVVGSPPCPADLNGDGSLNVDDVDLFVVMFLGADLSADCNGDGILNVEDVDCFVVQFRAGCP